MGCLGELIERYSAAFYNPNEIVVSSYKQLKEATLSLDSYALFHENQYNNPHFIVRRLTDDLELSCTPTIDLTTGKEIYCPAQLIYLPYGKDHNFIDLSTSTGLSSHTDIYQAILNSIYESIERDSFVLTWMQNIVPPKIIIDDEIKSFINTYVPDLKMEWHFFDVTYDLQMPTIWGFCFGNADFGDFVCVASATRSTYGEALKKTIQELVQEIPFFRYRLGTREALPEEYSDLNSFEDHAIFYIKNKELWTVFDKYIHTKETKKINFSEKFTGNKMTEIKRILSIFKNKGYNVLLKNLTTCDISEFGFHVIRIYIPQLIRLGGMYPYYYLGSERLYSVPRELGYKSNNFEYLNPYPHPFP